MSKHPLVAEYEADFPDDELIVYCNTAVPIEGWPHGFECLIRVPKAKIAAALAAAEKKEGAPPLWRHGDVIEVHPPRGRDGEVSPVT